MRRELVVSGMPRQPYGMGRQHDKAERSSRKRLHFNCISKRKFGSTLFECGGPCQQIVVYSVNSRAMDYRQQPAAFRCLITQSPSGPYEPLPSFFGADTFVDWVK